MKRPAGCPKCNGSMSRGAMVDQGYGQARVAVWQAGEPRKSIWVGLKQSKADQIEIWTWRCDRCGYLENYAPSR